MIEPMDASKFTPQAAKNAFERKGIPETCPACSQNGQWNIFPSPLMLTATDQSESQHDPVKGTLVIGIPAFAMTCKKCGFLRLHDYEALIS